jgi:glycosyltransferase involved in cell wall biosynthesis
MFEIVREVARAGWAVSFVSMTGLIPPSDELIDCGICLVEESLGDHLEKPDIWYDIVMICGRDNFERWWRPVRLHQPWAKIVYGCEAAAKREVENRHAREADLTVVVSEDEVLPPFTRGVALAPRRFGERRGLGFVAPQLAGGTSEGLFWFAAEILPIVRDAIPWVRLRVAGANPPVELLELSDANIRFEPLPADLGRFCEEVRVIISPTRFGDGVNLSTRQASRFAVPAVSTAIGAEGIDARARAGLIIVDEPDAFAAAVIRLLTDERVWLARREALARIDEAQDGTRLRASWSTVLAELCDRRSDGHGAALVQR